MFFHIFTVLVPLSGSSQIGYRVEPLTANYCLEIGIRVRKMSFTSLNVKISVHCFTVLFTFLALSGSTLVKLLSQQQGFERGWILRRLCNNLIPYMFYTRFLGNAYEYGPFGGTHYT